MRIVMLVVLATTPALAVAQTHYLDLYNNAPSSLASFAVATAGTNDFHDIALGERPLPGGGDSTTIALEHTDGECVRDFRMTFADGRVWVRRGFNVCRFRSFHTGRSAPKA